MIPQSIPQMERDSTNLRKTEQDASNAANLHKMPMNTRVMGLYGMAWNAVGPANQKREGYF